MEFIGVHSLFIIVLTAVFTGMVYALEAGRAFARFSAEGLTGSLVTISLARELGPVMAGLMVTARAGSAMAAQLGTMRVTQQIDALEALAVEPINYLIVPRIIASIVMLPILTGIFDMVGSIGGYFVGVHILEINKGMFVSQIEWYVDPGDVFDGLAKSCFFGLILSLVGCYKGYHTIGGAEGVGKATTQAVVISSVAILISDYFLTALVFKMG
jgi:phospholipid/cholesterol/gamma-HCH transport system permease protein